MPSDIGISPITPPNLVAVVAGADPEALLTGWPGKRRALHLAQGLAAIETSRKAFAAGLCDKIILCLKPFAMMVVNGG
jgi:hypothetical protein